MREIIEKIEEYFDDEMEGYIITTNQKEIKLLIDNCNRCCENWGYCDTADNIQDFIGAELLDINTICSNKELGRFKEKLKYEYYSLDNAEFIELITNKGIFTISIYNQHNGYYSHNILIQVGNCIIHDIL